MEIERLLRIRMAAEQVLDYTSALFVLWAAEYIRSRFEGGQLTWEFVFRGLDLRENRGFAVELVKRGLPWWGRKVRVSEGDIHFYLYTLMAEGGLPQALLMQQGLYGRVVKGLLADIETEGPDISDELAHRIARRRTADLPQAFRTDDIARLLGDVALALVRLRAEPPQDIPPELIDRWLERHHPDWVKSLPLRLSKEVAENLIRPALRAERKASSSSEPIAWRALMRNEDTGVWKSVVRLPPVGALAAKLLPAANGLRLRFLLAGNVSSKAGMIVYSATPNESGWELRRIGESAGTILPLDLDASLILVGFADGRLMGEVEVVPAVAPPDEIPSFWRTADGYGDGDVAKELLPLEGVGRTRSSRIWLLTTEGTAPIAGEGVTLGEPHMSSVGRLWPIFGTGEIRLNEWRGHVTTNTDEDPPNARLTARAAILPYWRLAGNGGHVFLGTPTFYGQRHTGAVWELPKASVQKRKARLLMGEIAEWLEKNAVLARLRYVALPQDAQIVCRESSAGVLEVRTEHIPRGFSLSLAAGQTETRTRLPDGSGRLTLSVLGAPPGIVTLRLSSPEEGKTLDLVCPWPALSGMILGPGNARLQRDTPLSVEALRGWRVIVPEGGRGELQFQLHRHHCVAVRVAGEMPLAAHTPLIQSMLAHGGPDALVRISLIVGGKEGPRLEIRRYHCQATILKGGSLRLGLPGDRRPIEETALSQTVQHGKAVLHAVDLNAPERSVDLETELIGDIDLRYLLPEGDTTWLIQARLNGEVQRATVWSSKPFPSSSREERITKYETIWRQLSESPNRLEWNRQWTLIRAAAAGGDAGVLDQVQALARVPEAAIRLVLRVPVADLSEALGLDAAAPIFWPVFPVEAFHLALTAEYSCLDEHYKDVLEDHDEARIDACAALARRITAIMTLHPELAGHFGAALARADFFATIPTDLLAKIVIPPSDKRLVELAQEAARRIDWLPSGVRSTKARHRPPGMPPFNSYTRSLIDAPIATAEIACGLCPRPDTASMLSLINLRLIDPNYFDAALPIALARALQKGLS